MDNSNAAATTNTIKNNYDEDKEIGDDQQDYENKGKERKKGVRIEENESCGNELTQKKKRGGRHGARNQHRHKHVVKWIVKTFPEAVRLAKYEDDEPSKSKSKPTSTVIASSESESKIDKSNNEKSSNSNQKRMHILDVAGGKGELAARLTLCNRLCVRMVDPRPADVLDCFHKIVFRSLPKKWQEKIKSQDAQILETAIQRRFYQHVMHFPCDSDKSMCLSELKKNKELMETVKSASLLIGMHSDGATEAIVDVAMHYRKPFMVVPCCVFPNFFTHRFIPRDIEPSNHKNFGEQYKNNMIAVRSHEQFCKYLLLKDSHFIMETLPFEGRNTAIWWDGLELDADETDSNIQ